MIWIPCKVAQPEIDDTYLVTTAKGALRFDRYKDGKWGMCNPQCRGAYKPHLAWAKVTPYKPKEGRI